ncbi:hypothetical protein HBDW_15430 [Herbaspirillum sp. DW155]|uniref:hypothetical protein n=1 Tax=Herbaspirillum sp. DW155 TaxID=3095609 RepID=UPI003085695C|nr:hypothetical protein HBDW_15430 [Herbaspirillum sp. DW155]
MSINSVSNVHQTNTNTTAAAQQAPKKQGVNFNDLLKATTQSTQVAQSTASQPSSTDSSTITTTPTRTV